MSKDLYRINDKYKNNYLLNVIKSELIDLKNEIKYISEEGKEIEKPNEIIDIVEEILEFNKQNHRGQGLKILTPDQMLSRLQITLKQEIIHKNLKTKLGNYCILWADQKTYKTTL